MRLLFAFVLLGSTVCRAEAPPQALIDRLTEVIKQKCPDAAFETGERGFTAKQGTMTFTLHPVSKTGEVSEKTYQEEGPNFKGFLLQVSVVPLRFQSAAAVPQTQQQQYFTRYHCLTEDGQAYYHIVFAYGSRLDPELKKAIMEAPPRSLPRKTSK